MHHADTGTSLHPLRLGLRLSQGLLMFIFCLTLPCFLRMDFEGPLDSVFQLVNLVEACFSHLLLYVGVVSLGFALFICDYDEEALRFTCSAYPEFYPGLMEMGSVLLGLVWPLVSLALVPLAQVEPTLWCRLWPGLHMVNAALWFASGVTTLFRLYTHQPTHPL